MDGAKDPDEFIIKYGNAKFNMLVQNAISLIEFKTKMLKKDLDLNNINDKIKFLKEIAKLLTKVESKIEQELYLNKIATEYNISKEAIYAEINKLSVKNQTVKILEKPKPTVRTEKVQNLSPTEEKRENMIIALLIKNGLETYTQIKGEIEVQDFKSEVNKIIIKRLFEEFDNNQEISNVLNLFEDEEVINKISEILVDDYELKHEKKALESIINIYEREKLTTRKNEIIQKIAMGDSGADIKKLENELNEIIKKLTPKK